MDIKAILAKVLKAEALTDEEKQALTEYDPDRIAAAGRKKAEADLKVMVEKVTELEAQLAEAGNEGKTETEKLQKQLEKLTKTVAEKDALIQKAEADRKKGIRDGKISKVLGGIKIMDGVDPDLVKLALERSFADVADDDLEDQVKTKEIVTGFVTKNKALILGDQGGGTGTRPKDEAGGSRGSSDPSKMTAEEREKDLKKRGII
jgi:hypothetical protein